MHGLLQSRCLCQSVSHDTAIVLATVGNDRPTIVRSATDAIDFIAAKRAVFSRPECARARVKGESVRIAMTQAPDFRARASPPDERVVLWNSSVVIQSNDLSVMRPQFLRELADVSLAKRDEQISIAQQESRAQV